MKRALAPVALLVSSPAMAQDAPLPAWQGVWKGTIGTLPVQACFARIGDSYSRGAYFYLSGKRLIQLEFDDGGDWVEKAGKGGAESGRWTVSVATDGSLRGEWKGSGKVLPVSLKPVGGAEDREEACGSRAFIAPRIQAPVVKGKPATVPGLAYTMQEYRVPAHFENVSMRSFTFVPVQAGDKAIIAAARLEPDQPDARGDYISCMQGAISMNGMDGDYTQQIDPEWATPAFMSIKQTFGGYCGGAHPDWGYSRELWDRQTGTRVDLARWFIGSAVKPGGETAESTVSQLSPAIRAAILKGYKSPEAECREAAAEQDWWGIGLTRTGFVFTPSFPHVMAACTEDAQVPLAEVSRFLTPLARKQVARLRAGGW
ncbi:hypothetical protein [Novosphingobium sp. TH158]|uniref:hypothetical protein n=1 Tax=Novosphingobium sp. TH158 TaxID=2067455 RepID=UPI000C7D5770|nr:hypothetical protein [Novosphingobium sp. TH158]PLK26410.1 hypothetical protein C0V78_05590 [Novosphingobium sp. TH158]